MKNMKSKFFRNKFFSVGMFVFLMLFIVACSSSDNTLPLIDIGKDTGISYRVTLLQTTDMHSRASGVGPFLSYTPMVTGNDTVLGGFAR